MDRRPWNVLSQMVEGLIRLSRWQASAAVARQQVAGECRDSIPLLDLKPYLSSVPEEAPPRLAGGSRGSQEALKLKRWQANVTAPIDWSPRLSEAFPSPPNSSSTRRFSFWAAPGNAAHLSKDLIHLYETDLIHLYDDKPIAFPYAQDQELNLQPTQRSTMMNVRLMLSFALLLICTGTGAALAQGTPDWETPAQEAVCNGETGAAFGLCNAYCEAMDCESENAQASATACTKVKDKFTNITGRDLPCEAFACPCQALPEWNAVLAGEVLHCATSTGNDFVVLTTTGAAGGTDVDVPPLGGGCVVATPETHIILSLTPEQGAACEALLATFCPAR